MKYYMHQTARLCRISMMMLLCAKLLLECLANYSEKTSVRFALWKGDLWGVFPELSEENDRSISKVHCIEVHIFILLSSPVQHTLSIGVGFRFTGDYFIPKSLLGIS